MSRKSRIAKKYEVCDNYNGTGCNLGLPICSGGRGYIVSADRGKGNSKMNLRCLDYTPRSKSKLEVQMEK